MPKVEFKLGADPEFLCASRNITVYASDHIHKFTRENQSVDGIDSQDPISRSEFGRDGAGTPFEIRPKPETDPVKLVMNIREILSTASRLTPTLYQYDWLAGSYRKGCSIGGHIHFGIRSVTGGNTSTYEVLTRILDDYLGIVTTLVESHEEGKLRRATGYGCPGQWREQPHGFEYRTPGSWLTSPYIATGILCLGKTVVNEVLGKTGFKFRHHATTGELPSPLGVSDKIRLSKMPDLIAVFDSVWEDITKMELYKEYKQYLEVLRFLIVNKRTWYPSVSMKEAWGISEISIPMPKSVSINDVWSKYKLEAIHT